MNIHEDYANRMREGAIADPADGMRAFTHKDAVALSEWARANGISDNPPF